MARVVIAQLRLKGFFYHVLPKKSLCFNLTIVETFTNCYKPQILHISLMINRQQKFLSSSFLIILALARSILFIIHMISDALKLKHKALFLSQCKALERKKEGAQGTMGITKCRRQAFSFLPSSSTASLSVIQSVPDGGGQSQSSDVFMLFFFLQLLMCGTGNISVSDFRQNHSVINSGMSFGKVVKRLH